MGVAVTSREWQTLMARIDSGSGYTAPSATSYYVGLLTTGLSLSAASTASDVAAGELPNANGYTREVLGRQIASMATDTLTMTYAHGLANNDIVHIVSTGSVYTGLSTGTPYYVINATSTTLQLSASSGGIAIALSGGSGTQYLKMSPVYDTGADNRAEVIYNPVVFDSQTADITYQGWFLLAGANSTIGNSTGTLVAYEYYGSSQTLVNASPTEIRIRAYMSDRGSAAGATS